MPAASDCDRPLRVGLVVGPGEMADGGYGQSAYEGSKQAAGAAPGCFETSFVEVSDVAAVSRELASFVERGFDVVIGACPSIGDLLGDAAAAAPDVLFIGVDAVPAPGHDATWTTNGQSVLFAEDQAGYLAGVLAASISKANIVGAVGGSVKLPSVERYVEGFLDGASDTREEIEAEAVYTNSSTDPQQGLSAATNLIARGADVVFAAGGPDVDSPRTTASGVIEGACAFNAWAIGADTDQYVQHVRAQRCILSSVTKDVALAVREALLEIARGEFEPGVHVYDAAEGAIGLAPFRDHAAAVPTESQLLLEETLRGLADGSIVPDIELDGA